MMLKQNIIGEKNNMQNRALQPKIGKDAIIELSKLIESKNGLLNGLSIFESNFSTGLNSKPDLVYREYGIEVKNIQFLDKNNKLGTLKINSYSWFSLKDWCKKNNRKVLLIVRLTKNKDSLFLIVKPEVIDLYKEEFDIRNKEPLINKCRNYKGRFFGVNIIRLISDSDIFQGEIS
jgi:hypothetical protein